MSKGFVTEQSIFLETSPARVFGALTESRELVKWFLVKAEVDARKGGAFSFDWLEGFHLEGNVSHFVKNKAVAYTWPFTLGKGKVAETVARFDVERKEAGALVTLRHERFTDPSLFAVNAQRWAYYLMNLKSVLDHGIDLRSNYDWQ